MENLIRETLDHVYRLTPIFGVGLAPLDASDEDREGDEEADDRDDKEDRSDIHDICSFTDRGSVSTYEP
jgi:hypothetical protein